MMPVAGSTEKVTIFSGVSCATSSMSMPPSVETTNDTSRGFAVDQDREIELLVDVGAVLDVEAVDLLAGGAGLHRDQRRAQHLLGEVIDLVDRLGEAHAALVAGGGFLELALAAAAGVDLALHHPDRAGKRFRGRVRIGRPAAPARPARSARRIRAAAPWPGIHGYSSGRSPNPRAVNSAIHVNFAAGIPYTTRRNSNRFGPRQEGARKVERNQRPSRSGAIFLQASTRPCTAPTDLSNASRSLPASSISTMRSTPFDPITTGTPTYMSFTPYSPLR